VLAPPLAERALALAGTLGFERSCSPEVARLLHVLAGARGHERVAEIGSGTGLGAAWITAALPPGARLFTAELDQERAAAVAGLFAGDADVRVLAGDWRETLPPLAPFDLVFFDATKQVRPREDGELVAGMLAPGATVVMDDLSPGRPVEGDAVREFWLRHPRVAAVELQVSSREAVIVGTLQPR
jgi:predicted O-methyltransferase YrrM